MLNMNTQQKLIEEIIGQDRSETVAKCVFISGVSVLVLMAMPFTLRLYVIKQTRIILSVFMIAKFLNMVTAIYCLPV